MTYYKSALNLIYERYDPVYVDCASWQKHLRRKADATRQLQIVKCDINSISIDDQGPIDDAVNVQQGKT